MDSPATRNFCPACGAELEPGASFCVACGAQLGAAPAPSLQTLLSQQSEAAPLVPVVPRDNNTAKIIGCAVGAAVLLVLVWFGAMAFLAMPNYVKIKQKAKEAESKNELHNIQLAVERFAVDHGGAYPEYLIGGSASYGDAPLDSSSNGVTDFGLIQQIPNLAEAADPLIAGGYLTEYPRNPFTRNGPAIHKAQGDLRSAAEGSDPLRSGTVEAAQYGTRFGADCTLMGSVLADPRYPEWLQAAVNSPRHQRSYADIEYEFWDAWQGTAEKPYKPYLPGHFFYKSAGRLTMSELLSGKNIPPQPGKVDQYIMGAYGGVRTKGMDVLGPEAAVPLRQQQLGWNWTRSEVSPKDTERDGSPYYIGPDYKVIDGWTIAFGNPNGTRDAIVLVLSSGQEIHDGSAESKASTDDAVADKPADATP